MYVTVNGKGQITAEFSRARADWQDTLRRYGVNTLVLNKEFHTDLIRTVRQERGWQKAYEDKMGVVFTRAR